MKKIDLNKKFIEALNTSSNKKKSELVSFIADTLNIERESVSRRLNGKVLFTINEMGIIARKLGLSIDSLLNENSGSTIIPLRMDKPLAFDSLDPIVNIIEFNSNKIKEIAKDGDVYLTSVFDSLPVEFFIPYKHLCKFMYFKWGYYFVGKNSYNNYAGWMLPDKVNKWHDELMNSYYMFHTRMYIWDVALIWNLVNEIEYLYKIHVLNEDDVEYIKKDLHDLLDNIESIAKGVKSMNRLEGAVELYVSSINIGLTCAYYSSGSKLSTYIKNAFIQSTMSDDNVASRQIKEWVDSLKKVSTLISGSGEKERRIFFGKQHQFVDMIL